MGLLVPLLDGGVMMVLRFGINTLVTGVKQPGKSEVKSITSGLEARSLVARLQTPTSLLTGGGLDR